MKSVKILVAIALAVSVAVFATTAFATPLPNGTVLLIEQGVSNPADPLGPCVSGSCFSMEVGGSLVWTVFGPGNDGGIVVGKDQLSGGQELGLSPDPDFLNPGDLSAAWAFFSIDGTFFTSPPVGGGAQNIFDNVSCSGAACIGKTELKVFNVAWNGNVIPMGSAAGCTLSSCTANQQAGIFVSDWQINGLAGTWSLTYSQVVPEGGFVGVPFTATMRGFVDLCADAATRCNDSNVCTIDGCNQATGLCTHTPDTGAACNDGNACTEFDKCSAAGVCVAGPTPTCNDSNICTTDACSPMTGTCVFTANTNLCNDSNACTTNDVCANKVCAGTPKNCNDNNICTTDTCAAGVCSNVTLSCCGTPGTPLAAGTKLGITQGVGSAMNVQCATGSCFSMAVGPGLLQWTDFGPGTDGGIVVGKSQGCGSFPEILPPTPPDSCELSNSWSFFGHFGAFVTTPDGGTRNIYDSNPCSGACCIGKTEIKVWNVGWNGNLIPMGSAAGCTLNNCSAAQKEGIFVNDYQINPVTRAWSINFNQVVPSGSYMNVPFGLMMRGMATIVDPNCPDDGNTCTDEVMVNNVCTHPYNTAACNDGNACTVNDACSTGVCAGTPRNCDDGNLCTADSCDPATGCKQVITVFCTTGECNPLTGQCWDPSQFCNDNNPCTTDTFDSTIGACIYTNNTLACNDGNACTVNDMCSNGVCVAGTPTSCDDSNCCTIDSCTMTTGACVNTAIAGCGGAGNPLPAGTKLGINAGNGAGVPCTTGSCFGMEVQPGYVVWTDFGPGTDGGIVVGKNQANGELSSTWSFFGSDGTFNTMPGGTTNLFDNAPCSGVMCVNKTELNVFNVLWNGLTVPMGGPCGVSDYQIVNVPGGAWSMSYGSVVPADDPSGFGGVRFSAIFHGSVSPPVCTCPDDGNACTTDACNASGVCVHTPLTGTACSDGNLCTTNDVCSNGVCAGTAIICNDNNVCTSDVCIGGSCQYNNNTAACNDGNACTMNDTCSAGICKGTARNCNDNNACTADSCNPATGACVNATITCNDNNDCTTDTCSPATGCVYTTIPGSTKSVTIRGGGGKPSSTDLQVQTNFTVQGSGCIVGSTTSSIDVTPGTSLQLNVKAGAGPQPTTGTWLGAPIPVNTDYLIVCPTATGDVGVVTLNNKLAGGKDSDRMTISVQ